jgi:hypothetical protein
MIATLCIPLAFIALASLSLWIVIGGKGHWAAKAVVMLLTLYLGVAFWLSLGNVEGWPSPDPLPAKFALHWALVQEPSKNGGDAGAVYLWVTSAGDEPRGASWVVSLATARPGEPRAYRLPYSRRLHEKVEGALGKIRAGRKVEGKAGGLDDEDQQGQPGRMDDRKPGHDGPDQDPMFYDMPPPKPPSKPTN